MKRLTQLLLVILLLITTNSIIAQVTGDYRTKASGNWNAATTWEVFNGTSWVDVSITPTSSNGAITILDNHVVTVTANVTVDQVVMESLGSVKVSSGTMTIANGTGTDCIVNGAFENSGGAITISSSGSLVFNSGAVYTHNRNGGSLPSASLTTWNLGSTCIITGITSTTPSQLAQLYANLVYNCPGQTINVNFTTSLHTIKQAFTVLSTGTRYISLATSGTHTLSIGNDYIQSGGTLLCTTTGTRTVSVNGNFNLTGGMFDLSSSSGTTRLYVRGDFNHTSGTLTRTTASTTGTRTIEFAGSALQEYNPGGTVSGSINYTLNNPVGLELNGDFDIPNNSVLSLTQGLLITNDKMVNIPATGSVIQVNGVVSGSMKKTLTTSSQVFEVGTSQGKTPVTLTNITGSGDFVVTAIENKHPNRFNENTLGMYWKLTNSGIVSADIKFNYLENHISGNEQSYMLARYNGSSFDFPLGSVDYNLNEATVTGVSLFSDWVLAESSALPVELSTFSASVIGSKVKLKWKTDTETNNYGFEVERRTSPQSPPSKGGDDEVRGGWAKVGFVLGNNNSNSPKNYSFTDESASTGRYSYRLKQIDNDGTFEFSKAIEVDLGAVKNYELTQNYPNPFNPTTTIRFTLPEAGFVKLKVYNLLGQEVRTLVNETKESGVHTINFKADELNSGVYIYKLETNGFTQSRKMTLIK